MNLDKLIASLYLALVIFILLIFGLVIWIARSIAGIYRGGARACGAGIRYYERRVGVAESDRIDGAFRRAAAHRKAS
jgi:hypothetical protein